MKIKKKIKQYYDEQKYARITRLVAKDWTELSQGYIVGYSKEFVILQDVDEFKLLGFNLFPIYDIVKIEQNKSDKYTDKIMKWENEKPKVGLKTKVDLKSWESLFKTFQKKNMSIIVECENPNINSFTIGEVKKVSSKSVSILYFNSRGYLDEKPTRLRYSRITNVMFDTRYVDVFSKYTRKRK